jgi:N-acetylneuraminate synthase
MLAFKKPGDGIPAAQYRTLIGRKLKRDLPADSKLSRDSVE